MKKRIIAILIALVICVGIIVIPDVDAGVSTLNITNMSKTIEAGKSFQIKLNGLKSSKVKWSSSKPSVATVTKKGVVTGIKKGKSTIIGKYKGIKFTIKTTVTSNPQSEPTTPQTDSSGLYLGKCKNVEFYYIKRTKNTIYIKVVNNNNINLRVNFEYINIDSTTINELGGSNVVSANDYRTIELYNSDGVPNPQNKISTYVEIWKENYEDFGKGSLSATIK